MQDFTYSGDSDNPFGRKIYVAENTADKSIFSSDSICVIEWSWTCRSSVLRILYYFLLGAFGMCDRCGFSPVLLLTLCNIIPVNSSLKWHFLSKAGKIICKLLIFTFLSYFTFVFDEEKVPALYIAAWWGEISCLWPVPRTFWSDYSYTTVLKCCPNFVKQSQMLMVGWILGYCIQWTLSIMSCYCVLTDRHSLQHK